MTAHARTSFVGRTEELAAIDELFAGGARLVTLLGPPGIGKTRLARRWMEGRAGVWFAALADARSVEDVLAAVGAALDVPLAGAGPDDTARQIGYALDARGAPTLVLDNVEQVVAHAADTISRWLDDASGVRLLVTSRARLFVDGEHCLDVGPLADDHAIALFEDRVRMIRADLARTDTTRAAIRDLVHRLDRSPLAIELAAARARVLGVAQLLERTSESLALLRDRRRDGSTAASSLDDAIGLSWELLADHERAALAHCSVFRGGFSLEAAERVIDVRDQPDAPAVVDIIQALRDKSLIYAYEPDALPGDLRFGLYFSIQDHAARRLTDADRAAAEQRHRDYYLDRGSAWPQTAPARSRLELDNLLEVHRRSLDRHPAAAASAVLALHDVFKLRGPVGYHLRLLDAAIAAAERAADPALITRALLASGEVRAVRGHLAEARHQLERVRELASASGDPVRERLALVWLARVDVESGDPDAARIRLARARQMGPTGTPAAASRHADGLTELVAGIVEHYASRHVEAASHYERARAVFAEVGDGQLEGQALTNLAIALMLSADDRVASHLVDALALFRAAGDRFRETETLSELGWSYADHGRRDEASTTLATALASAREIGHRRNEGAIQTNLGLLALDLGNAAAAREHLEDAVSIHRQTHHRHYLQLALGFLAIAELADCQVERARDHLRASRDLARELHSPMTEKLATLYLGAAELALGDLAAASASLDAGRALAAASPAAMTATFELLAGHRDLIDGRTADAADRVAAAAPVAARSVLVRITARTLQAAIDRHPRAGAGPAIAGAAALEVAPGARWFRPPGHDRVDLSRHGPARLVLDQLVRHRLDAPDAALDVVAVARIGWPGEPATGEAAANRVYAAISSLRRMGLGELLLTRADGYLLDPGVPVVVRR